MIARDEEVKKTQTQINSGMQLNATNLQNYLSTWDNYREIWEINKDAFIRRYQKLNPQVSSFDADIARLVLQAKMVRTHSNCVQHLGNIVNGLERDLASILRSKYKIVTLFYTIC